MAKRHCSPQNIQTGLIAEMALGVPGFVLLIVTTSRGTKVKRRILRNYKITAYLPRCISDGAERLEVIVTRNIIALP